ncbi:MAG: outer membrane protein assembly factor BamE [Janthinobacterium lividum]
MMQTRFTYVILTGILILSVGCETHVTYRGKLPDPDQLAKIKPGAQDKEEVLRLIGSPSSISTFNDNMWIYDYKILESESFFTPREVMHRLYLIDFDIQGKVKEIRTQDGHGHNISPVKRATASPGDDRTFLQTIFGNFGKRVQKSENEDRSKG